MKLIVCLDENDGMTFNNRRQSKDRVVGERIKEIVGSDKKIYISPKTENLFNEYGLDYIADEDYLKLASNNDYCFCEFELPEEKDVDEIIVFRWARNYPRSTSFTYDLDKWNAGIIEVIAGNSHEEIYIEPYTR